MHHFVPILDDGEPSSLPKPNKTNGQDDIIELCWENGQVVFQNQSNQKKTPFDMAEREIHSNVSEGEQPPLPLPLPLLPPLPQQPPHLFIQEDEMSSWLQYPLDESAFGPNLCDDLLYHTPPPLITTVPQPQIRTPPPPESLQRLQNFVNLSRFPIRQTAPPAGEATVVDSSETPMVVLESKFSHMMWDTGTQMITESGSATPGGTSAAAVELAAGTEVTTMSSPGGSRNSLSTSGETHPQRPPLPPPPPEEDRKRKAIIVDDHECEDIEFEAPGGKKLTRGSTSATKRTRAAEVHNQSERRRRDRINEKMRLLQELIPRCNKSDKASMLDEAIEYLKSLQMQVQMMSMGCGMVPMMYSNMQQYMPSMGMGIGMGGMNINMADMGMNRPAMVPYPGLMPNPAAAHMTGARYPMPPYPMHPVPAAAPAPAPTTTRIPPANPTDPAPNFAVSQNQTQPGMLNFVAPYQQYPALHLSQVPLPPQNQAAMPSGANKKKENGSSGTKRHNGDKKSNEKRDGGVPPPD